MQRTRAVAGAGWRHSFTSVSFRFFVSAGVAPCLRTETELVGIAGALGKDLAKADVVVTKVVWNYEYGKIAEGFKLRPDHTYPTDTPLANAAEIFGEAKASLKCPNNEPRKR